MDSTVYHAYIDFLRYISFETYSYLASCWGVNDFVFTGAIDEHEDVDQLVHLVRECTTRTQAERNHSRYKDARSLAEAVLRIRHEIVPKYLEFCAKKVVARAPTLVGLTCMFDQTMASVALARQIKQMAPDVMIALGGYALEGEPGIEVLKTFPWIDCIARGDGEPIIGKLARASIGQHDLNQITGIITRDLLQHSATADYERFPMDSSPDPDYDDWFLDVETLQGEAQVEIRGSILPVEASRGCWYGQHHHCVFCGIDDNALQYRYKSPERVLEMLSKLRQRYGPEFAYRFNDYILPGKYYSTLVPALERVNPKFRLQAEIKSNQTPKRMHALRSAGFTDLQPGIESFSSDVLTLMDKGVSAIRNVLTLKSGYVNGIVIHYNVLYGLPGEQASWYIEMLKRIPTLYHLQPPVSRAETEITRGAPLQVDPPRFGILRRPRHSALYEVIFSRRYREVSGFCLDGYAYYFERDYSWNDDLAQRYAELIAQINHWKARHLAEEVYLGYRTVGSRLLFIDSRFGGQREVELNPYESQVYLTCDEDIVSIDALKASVGGSDDDIHSAIEHLSSERLIWHEAEHIYGLGVDVEVVRARIDSGWKAAWTSLYC